MKTISACLVALLLNATLAFANLGETQEELFKRYGQPADSVNTSLGGGLYRWRNGPATHEAHMEQGRCIRQEWWSTDESTLSKVMRDQAKRGQVWSGSNSFFKPGETRTLKLTGQDITPGKIPVLTITRDSKKILFRATLRWE